MPQQSRPSDHLVIDELLANGRQSKWTVAVVLHLGRTTMRFSELQRDIGGISQKALTSSLKGLERDGFVTRTSYATIPPRVDYALTELGFEILKAYQGFERFATLHWHQVVEARALFDARESDQFDVAPRLSAAGR
jgi:DNA-binding HxlR family transcriptional regulator